MTHYYSDFDWEEGDEGELLVSTPARMGEPGETLTVWARFSAFEGQQAVFFVDAQHALDEWPMDEQWCLVEFRGQSIDPGFIHVFRGMNKEPTRLWVGGKFKEERESVLDRVLE